MYEFTNSIVAALGLLLRWEIYVGAIEYLLIVWIPLIFVSLFAERTGRDGLGCFFLFFIAPAFQAFATLVFVFSLAPIALGMSDEAAWAVPWRLAMDAPLPMLKTTGLLVVVSIATTFVPILGRMQTFGNLIVSAAALVLFIGILDTATALNLTSNVVFFPGWGFSLGILVATGILSYIAFVAVGLLSALFGGEDFGALLAMPVAAVFGFLPFFVYAAWIGAQL